MRYLANAVIHQGHVYPNAIVQLLDDTTVDIKRFDGEQHSTTYIPGLIVVVKANSVDDTLRAQLTATVRHATLLAVATRRVTARATDLNIFQSSPTEPISLLILPRR